MLRKFQKKVSRDTIVQKLIIFGMSRSRRVESAQKCNRNAEKRTEIAAGRPKWKHEDVYAGYFRKKIAGRDRRALRDRIKDEEA